MKLITELNMEQIEYITEEVDGQKNLYIEGLFLQAVEKNRNGRIYPKSLMEMEVDRYTRTHIDAKIAWGELEHPDGPQINFDRVSHRITELRQDGNYWIGKAIIVEGGKGDIVKGLIKSGGRPGVSSRGVGSLKESNGCKVVQEDFRLVTAADIVATPSAQQAFVNGIMEGVEWLYNDKLGWNAIQVAEQTKNEIEKSVVSRKLDNAKMLSLFENYFKTLIEK